MGNDGSREYDGGFWMLSAGSWEKDFCTRGNSPEELLHVVASLRRGLDEHHVQLLRLRSRGQIQKDNQQNIVNVLLSLVHLGRLRLATPLAA